MSGPAHPDPTHEGQGTVTVPRPSWHRADQSERIA